MQLYPNLNWRATTMLDRDGIRFVRLSLMIYGQVVWGVQSPKERQIETGQGTDRGYIFSQFSISRRQPSRFNCCKPSILIRTKNYFPFPFHCYSSCCLCCLFVCFQFAANVLDFIDFNCCIAKTIDYNGSERARERGGEQAGYLTDC